MYKLLYKLFYYNKLMTIPLNVPISQIPNYTQNSVKFYIIKAIIILLIILIVFQFALLLVSFVNFIYKYFLMREKNLPKVYGENSYVVITGTSSGQGYYFAKEMAKRGFNLLLISSERSKSLVDELKKSYPKIKVILIIKDFRKAYEANFFDEIVDTIEKLDGNISMLINNVAHRTAWIPYHTMPQQLINDTIIVGTIVQAQLCRICLPHFINRKHRSAIVNITAQCTMRTFGFGEILNNEISVPFLSAYESANAFGFYHGNSILKEYKKYSNKIDLVNIMPGAVVTDNTGFLKNTIFNINAEDFVKNSIKMIGNVNGSTCAYWGHAISVLLINIFPFIKNPVLYNTGYKIAQDYMAMPKKKY